MSRSVALLALVLTFLTVSCGSGRQLQSIAITQTVNGQKIEFVATGNFSIAPTTVTPLPVMWSVGPMAPPPPQYTLSTQPASWNCTSVGVEAFPMEAVAPKDPNAPNPGSWSHSMITASSPITCQ
jgi:hypothetical protein